MKTIKRMFKTLRQAENHQNRLYNKYYFVSLVSAPVLQEEGWYVWCVGNKKPK